MYQDQDFLNRAVCRFTGAALENGEGVILVPTRAHWEAFRPRLEAQGVDVETAKTRGQLTIVDADELLPEFMREAMPDGPIFLGLAADIISRTRAAGPYRKVRWWGEMVNVLWERGDVSASMHLEDLFDQVSHEQDIAIFCSFVMDNFDGKVHTRMLPRLGENHSHLIPVEDYARLESAVADALREIVGSEEGSKSRGADTVTLPGSSPHAESAGGPACLASSCYPSWQTLCWHAPRPCMQAKRFREAIEHTVDSTEAAAHHNSPDVADIFDIVDVSIVVVDPRCVIARFNRAAAIMLGLTPADIGKPLGQIQLLTNRPDIPEPMCPGDQCRGSLARGTQRRGQMFRPSDNRLASE